MAERESFPEQRKRRKVVRAGMVYGAVAFAVVQAADVFVPALGLLGGRGPGLGLRPDSPGPRARSGGPWSWTPTTPKR